MGVIASFQPGSIRTIDDVKKAIELVMLDLFADVVTQESTLTYSVDGDDIDVRFRISVTDHNAECLAMYEAVYGKDDDDSEDEDFTFTVPSAN